MGTPTPPIALEGEGPVTARLAAKAVDAPDSLLAALEATGAEVVSDATIRAEASRDWWPLAMGWALDGQVGNVAAAVVRPSDGGQVAEVLRRCNDARVPVTAAGGRSGVGGASVPVHGGVVLDTTRLDGIVSVDTTSGLLDVRAGTFGNELEAALRQDHGVTLGHWPQSINLSTVGGWLACRSAGQYSTRYGKIEDIVVGLDVALADGTTLTTGGSPRAAVGPDLTQVFVGSEGTLGVITGARLRVRPAPEHEHRAAFGFASFAEGLEACRRILRAGATPAVLRLYDEAETARSHGGDGATAALLVLDEGNRTLVDATFAVVKRHLDGVARLDDTVVDHWLIHRNDVSALEALTRKGYVVDTMEVAASWTALPAVADATRKALLTAGALMATCHLSHSYSDGACVYFTFAATPEATEREATYVSLWDAGVAAALGAGANLAHHHGVGLNRARYMRRAIGDSGLAALAALKQALDPNGILNPGKLGLPSPFGAVPWPQQ